MANYYGITRSNYFRVTDAERLEEIIEATCTDDGELELWSAKTEKGTEYAFGGYCSIRGLPPSFVGENDDYPEYGIFEAELQKIVDPDDAIIITEIGYEKLRYLTAYSIIITRNDSGTVDLETHAIETAARMLRNGEYNTNMEY